ncbi:glucosyl hydrolase [Nostoc sp. KVJ20]|uniref:glucosyl hydrolase n=1 Tax=unclassified Nostoc TaxID=2593658 RepID=UPI00083CA9D7|nr:glucosyl hydrolase [Nostoc sp. KVJ20]ODG99004.1 glucosyl hydrolase [Nostoc sp. KVJ20]
MIWKKLGLVYVANGEKDWAISHAYIPTSMMLDEERIRVYVAFLDSHKVGRVGFVDLEARNPLQILQVSDKPVLDIGQPGTFDDNGVTPICLLKYQERLYLYYVGWQLGIKVRYFLLMGLAISEDNGESFQRYSQVPILERSDRELFVRTAAHVHLEDGHWKMWYIAGSKWIDVNGKQVPSYNMRYLESKNQTDWEKQGTVCLDLANEDEYGFGRPFVIKEDGQYKMWYSIRYISKGYRLGYAESQDGKTWLRKDQQVGIDVSDSGWDSQMISMACIQKTKYGTYMFYNGNNYGETGFGVAILQE